jgi:hypothetical protein
MSFTRLSVEEMAQSRDAGLCYNCPTKYSKEHVRECSMKGIYLLDVPDDAPVDDTSDPDDTPCVSLNAITSISLPMTMHLGDLAGTPVRALVGSSSTHCFVMDATACQLGLPPSPRPSVTIGVANGDRVACAGLCAAVPLRITNEQFHVDLYVLPLGGYELVLGCQWLRALGPILWDFEWLSMLFWRDDHRILWFGLDAPRDAAVRAAAPDNLLQLLLVEYADLFAAPQGLPLPRQADHHIHLLPGAAPVAVRPYRYPQMCKGRNRAAVRGDAAAGHPSPQHLTILFTSAPRQEEGRHLAFLHRLSRPQHPDSEG